MIAFLKSLREAWSRAWFPLPALLLCAVSPLLAQWARTNGPTGAIVPNAVAFTPTAMILATPQGIFRSTDSGGNWVRSPQDDFISAPEASSLLATRGLLFAGCISGGIFRSIDDGRTWYQVASGTVYSLAANATTVFAGTDRGVLRSTDDGAAWTLSSSGLTDSGVYALAAGSNAILAGTATETFRSRDGGETWSKVPGLGGTALSASNLSAAGAGFFAATANGIFRSSDSGESWVRADKGFPGTAIPSLAAIGPDIFVATQSDGVYKSGDQGATWESVSRTFSERGLRFLAANGESLYAGTDGDGTYRATANSPGAWVRMEGHGFPNFRVGSVAAIGSRIYVSTRGYASVFESRDEGRTWREDAWAVPHKPVQFLPDGKGNLFAMDGNGNLYTKTEASSPWRTSLEAGFRPSASPILNNTFALAIGDPDSYLAHDGKVYRWDGGATRWDSVGVLDGEQPIRKLAAYGRHLAASDNTALYVSSDGGKSWTTSFSGQGVSGMLFLDSALFAVSESGMIRSDDFGNYWRPSDTGLAGNPKGPLAIAAGTLFAATDSGVYYTRGGDWKRTAAGLDEESERDLRVYELFADQTRLLAATSDGVRIGPVPEPVTATAPGSGGRSHGPRTSPAEAGLRGPRALFPSDSRWLDALGRKSR